MPSWKKASPFVFFLILAIACAKYLHGASSYYPLQRWDETQYLLCGLRGDCQLSWAPLYGFFLRILTFLTGDPMRAYYVNIALETTGLALLSFIVMRRMRAAPFVCLLLALPILLGIFNAPTFPKVNHFNTCAYLIALIAASYAGTEMRALGGLALFSLFSVYIRPDNVVVFALIVGRLAWLQGKKRAVFGLATLGGLAALYGIVIATIGSPFEGDRVYLAFADHYFWQHGDRMRMVQADFIRGTFGDARTLAQAALNNPRAFLGHVFGNLRLLLSQMFSWVSFHPPLSGTWILRKWAKAAKAETSLLLGCLFLCLLRSLKAFWQKTPQSDPRPWFPRTVLLLEAGFLVKAAATCAVMEPWHRYALEFLVFLPTVLAYPFGALAPRGFSHPAWSLLAVVLALSCPSHEALPYRADFVMPGQENASIREAVDFVRAFGSGGRPVKLFSEPAFAVYSGHLDFESWEEYYHSEEGSAETLGAYLRQKGVNLVVVDYTLRAYISQARQAVGAEDFEQMAAKYGFKEIKAFPSGTKIYFLSKVP